MPRRCASEVNVNGTVSTTSNSETEQAGSGAKASRLTLRNGVWYAGEIACKDYRDALRRTLIAADIAAPAKPGHGKLKLRQPEKRWPRTRLRLELRPWWEAYFDARAARLAGQRIPVEMETISAPPLRAFAAGGGQ